jgi:hypothetical protein
MSVLFTESWARFNRRAPATAELNNDLAAGGYELRSYSSGTSYPPTAPVAGTNKWMVDADPVYASRNALLCFRAGANSSSSGAFVLSKFDAPCSHYRMGVRARVAHTGAGAACRFVIGSQALAKNPGTTSYVSANIWDTLIGIDSVSGGALTGVSNSTVGVPGYSFPGGDVFIEVEVDTVNNLVRVWVDDLLIVDSAFAPGVLAAAKAEYDLGIGFGYLGIGVFPAIYVRDIYCLAVDDEAPFQRLGPTTQVIGEAPTDDISVEFTRPGGFASNAEVAALPVVPSPSDYLTADQVGQTDLYGVAASEVATAASQVYAVCIKTQVANFAAAAHTVGAVVRSGAVPVTGTESLGPITPGSGFLNKAAYFAVNPDTGVAWTPQEAADAEFGLTVLA